MTLAGVVAADGFVTGRNGATTGGGILVGDRCCTCGLGGSLVGLAKLLQAAVPYWTQVRSVHTACQLPVVLILQVQELQPS
jgi:hypothetical protein